MPDTVTAAPPPPPDTLGRRLQLVLCEQGRVMKDLAFAILPSTVATAGDRVRQAAAETAEVLGDLAYIPLMPADEHRVAKVAGCVAGLERAIGRLRRVFGPPVPTLQEQALTRAAELVGVLEAERPPEAVAIAVTNLRDLLRRIAGNG
jgi:hypothetical protein